MGCGILGSWNFRGGRRVGREFNSRLFPQVPRDQNYLQRVVRHLYESRRLRTVKEACGLLWYVLRHGLIPTQIPPGNPGPSGMNEALSVRRTEAPRQGRTIAPADRRAAQLVPRDRIEWSYLRELVAFLAELPAEVQLEEVRAALWFLLKQGHLPGQEPIAQPTIGATIGGSREACRERIPA